MKQCERYHTKEREVGVRLKIVKRGKKREKEAEEEEEKERRLVQQTEYLFSVKQGEKNS